MTDTEERAAILAEVIAFSRAPTLEPWQFTVRDYAAQAGIDEGRAYAELQAQVTAGRLESTFVRHDGKRVRAYWIKPNQKGPNGSG